MREISQKTSIHLTGIPERMNNLEEGIISKTQYKKKKMLRFEEHESFTLKEYT